MQAQKIVYTLLLLFSATVSLQAQKFVNLENRWRVARVYRGYPYISLAFFKDSVEIGGKYYYQPYDSVVNKLTRYDDDYYREEAGIVYRFQNSGVPGAPNEQVIYNFNMAVGDSIVYDRNFRLKVVKIDSITLLNGSKRKRWEFSFNLHRRPYSLYWIEGIGADIEPLRPELASFIGLVEDVNHLSCYFHQNELLYSNPYHEGSNGGLTCSSKLADPVSTRDLQELKTLEVLQNLGDGELIYQLNESGNYQTRLFNAVGALLEQKAVSQGTNRLTLAALPRGIYFLQVIDLNNFRQKTLKLTRQ